MELWLAQHDNNNNLLARRGKQPKIRVANSNIHVHTAERPIGNCKYYLNTIKTVHMHATLEGPAAGRCFARCCVLVIASRTAGMHLIKYCNKFPHMLPNVLCVVAVVQGVFRSLAVRIIQINENDPVRLMFN